MRRSNHVTQVTLVRVMNRLIRATVDSSCAFGAAVPDAERGYERARLAMTAHLDRAVRERLEVESRLQAAVLLCEALLPLASVQDPIRSEDSHRQLQDLRGSFDC